VPPVPPPVVPQLPVPGLPSLAPPTPTELNVAPPVIAKVAPEQLPLSVIVKVPLDMVELLEVLVVSCTPSISFPAALLVTPVTCQVPLATMAVVALMEPPRSLSRDMDLKRVKLPPPIGVLLVSPLPSSNNQSPPPVVVDCRSTTTRLKVSLVGGGVDEPTVRVTASMTGLFEAPEEVNVTLPL
jgi:hypothetical protein